MTIKYIITIDNIDLTVKQKLNVLLERKLFQKIHCKFSDKMQFESYRYPIRILQISTISGFPDFSYSKRAFSKSFALKE